MRHDRSMAAIFVFGVMSPYAWFSAERIDRLLPDADWRGVFLGAIFKARGRKSWGFDERREPGMVECEARARAYGLGQITWPERWPTNDLHAARAMLIAQRGGVLKPYALTAMRMAFREGADLGDIASVLEAGRRVGMDTSELEAGLSDPEVKSALRAATDEALALGVFGVPTVVIGEQLFWGDDRLEEAATAARSSPAGA
jgi:2-hydroxychromene-2-carboxylate isomerase